MIPPSFLPCLANERYENFVSYVVPIYQPLQRLPSVSLCPLPDLSAISWSTSLHSHPLYSDTSYRYDFLPSDYLLAANL